MGDSRRFRVHGDGLYPLIKDGDVVLLQTGKRCSLDAGSLLLREDHCGKRFLELVVVGDKLARRLRLDMRQKKGASAARKDVVDIVVAIERNARIKSRDGWSARCFHCLYFGLWPLARLLAAARRLLSLFEPRYLVAGPRSSLASVADKFEDPEEAAYCAGMVQQGLSREEQWLVDNYMSPTGRLLDVGCGTGREAFALASLGVRHARHRRRCEHDRASRAPSHRERSTGRVPGPECYRSRRWGWSFRLRIVQ